MHVTWLKWQAMASQLDSVLLKRQAHQSVYSYVVRSFMASARQLSNTVSVCFMQRLQLPSTFA